MPHGGRRHSVTLAHGCPLVAGKRTCPLRLLVHRRKPRAARRTRRGRAADLPRDQRRRFPRTRRSRTQRRRVPSPAGASWTAKAVSRIATNPVYAGERYGVKGAHRGIVSRRMFNRADARGSPGLGRASRFAGVPGAFARRDSGSVDQASSTSASMDMALHTCVRMVNATAVLAEGHAQTRMDTGVLEPGHGLVTRLEAEKRPKLLVRQRFQTLDLLRLRDGFDRFLGLAEHAVKHELDGPESHARVIRVASPLESCECRVLAFFGHCS